MTGESILLDDILDAVLLEESEPTYEALIRWSNRYQEHHKALAEFFATWAVQANVPHEMAVDEERLANLAVSHALNILHERDEAAKSGRSTTRSSPRLIATARAAGVSPEQLAHRVGLEVGIIQKLDLRRLTGIPGACFGRLAAVLATDPAHIREMIVGPALISAGTRYKAQHKPSATTQDFTEAIRTSSLPEEAKRSWLQAAADSAENNG